MAPAVVVSPASDPSLHGRIDADGTVWLRTASGERAVGSWQAGDAAEGLAHFGRRFDDLATEVELLETRLISSPEEAAAIRTSAESLLTGLPEAAVVGDVDALETRLHAVCDATTEAAEKARADKRARKERSLARKTALAEEAEQIGATGTHWKNGGDRLREILDEWKTIRGVDRREDDALWKRYSKARETFNRRRGAHFADLDRGRATARKAKEELVERARALADSTDWGATSGAFRDLMTEWKAAGRAPREADDALWAQFKEAQDHFFDARTAATRERDEEFERNATAKEALLAQYDSLVDPTADLGAARRHLRELQERWEAVGHVPRARIREFEGRIRAIEQRVQGVEEREWRRTDPAVQARAAQFRDKVADFEAQAAKAQAAGRTAAAEKARAQAAQWREWAEAAEGAIDS